MIDWTHWVRRHRHQIMNHYHWFRGKTTKMLVSMRYRKNFDFFHLIPFYKTKEFNTTIWSDEPAWIIHFYCFMEIFKKDFKFLFDDEPQLIFFYFLKELIRHGRTIYFTVKLQSSKRRLLIATNYLKHNFGLCRSKD
jgi:hypothetical protein